jgi:hypothetical protein
VLTVADKRVGAAAVAPRPYRRRRASNGTQTPAAGRSKRRSALGANRTRRDSGNDVNDPDRTLASKDQCAFTPGSAGRFPDCGIIAQSHFYRAGTPRMHVYRLSEVKSRSAFPPSL